MTKYERMIIKMLISRYPFLQKYFFNCSIGNHYAISKSLIDKKSYNYTEADMEYLQGRELSG